MEKKLNILLFFFLFVVVISLFGFFKSYLGFFPNFDQFPIAIHLHFTAFFLWFLLLIIQPIIIRNKQFQLHKKLGKISYILAPIIVLTILILAKNQIHRELTNQEPQAPITAFVALIDILSFSGYFLISMINRENTRWHVAFLIAATLVVLNPGLSRLLNRIEFGLGMLAAVLIPFIVSISILIYEKMKFKYPILKSPYFLYLCLWTLTIILFMTIPKTENWMQFVQQSFQ